MGRSPSLTALIALMALIAAALAFAACASTSGPGGRARPGQVVVSEHEGVAPEFLPALEVLQQAVQDEEDELARRILAQILAREPEGRALELARAFERILDGRALARDVELRLVARERADQSGVYDLELLATHSRDETVVYRPGAARLRRALVTVEPDGSEHRGVNSWAVPVLSELELPAETEVRLVLAELEPPATRGMLALRSRVGLELLAGELVLGDRRLPARERKVSSVEVVRLASFLPTSTVEPEELVRYCLGERIYRPALMERAVRIDPARREEALDLLAAEVGLLSLLRVEDLVPALRWLSDAVAPGGDPAAWREWLAERAARPPEEEPRAARGIDIPAARPTAASE